MVHEIEIKALLSEEKYEQLKKVLALRYKKVNEDTITTVRFRPKDIRVRYSDKINELVVKEGDPTIFSREEVCINLGSNEDARQMIALLRNIGFKDDPSWIKTKQEFVTKLNGHEYTLSLQHIPNFAYILEAEILCEERDDMIHVPNLKKILKDLGCEPIEPQDFMEKIDEYRKNNPQIRL